MAGTISQRIYDLASAYTNESLVILNNTDIKNAAATLQATMISAHGDGDINTSGSYTYYPDMSIPTVADLGISAIKEDNLISKIRGANTVFNFKNTLNSKYIMVYNQKAFLFDTEADFNSATNSFNWGIGAEVYTGGAGNTVESQYDNSLSPWVLNSEDHQ